MKLGRFGLEGRTFYGIVEGEDVHELAGSPFQEYQRTDHRHRLAALRVLVPCMPSNFYCAGLNYAAHIEWANRRTGGNRKPPEKADIGYRSPNALVATGEAIVIPADSPGPVQFEGELVAVIGKQARNLSEHEALSCVLGYTLGNDVSERAWQKQDRTLWRAKNCDTFKPMGPFIVTGLNPMDLTITINVNGIRAARYHTGKMLFSAQHYIAQISKYMTLWPGDVVWLGTDEATEPSLAHGDRVDIVEDHIGVLSSPVVRDGQSPR
jgi:2-keto-4-pentenoate hydratase/2-oxohepta-3-ene-1,7-dioic acid hydratase in catechol pathway